MNYKCIIVFCLCTLIFSSCGKKKTSVVIEPNEELALKPSLKLLWKTDSLLTTCESVLYDMASGVIYVTNINNSPWQKDGNGFISRMNTKGEIIDLKWMEGFSAPKGMGIYNGKFYVNDIDRLVEIDIAQKKIINEYYVDGDPNLNDITVGENGIVYSSGSKSNTIYKLEDNTLDIYASDGSGRVNGLLNIGEKLYYLDAEKGEFGVYNHNDSTFKVMISELGAGDGLVRVGNGDFISSSWKGEVFYIHSKDWSKTKLLDTRSESVNSADIEFISETKTLLVPTFFDNRVVAYKLICD